MIADNKDMIEKAAAYIIETGANSTESGDYIFYAEEMPEDIMPLESFRKNIVGIARAMQEYEAAADVEVTGDGEIGTVFYLDYCPNYVSYAGEAGDFLKGREILDALKSKRGPEKPPTLAERLNEGKRRAALHDKPENKHKLTKREARE